MSSFGPAALREILTADVLKATREEFAREGVKVELPAALLDEAVATAVRQGTGARGLWRFVRSTLEEAAFEQFGRAGTGLTGPA